MRTALYQVMEDSEGSWGKTFKPWAVMELIRGIWFPVIRFTSKISADFECRRRNREIENQK